MKTRYNILPSTKKVNTGDEVIFAPWYALTLFKASKEVNTSE